MSIEKKIVVIVGGSGYVGGEFLCFVLGYFYFEVMQVISECSVKFFVSMVYFNLCGVINFKFCKVVEFEEVDIIVLVLLYNLVVKWIIEFEVKGKVIVDFFVDFCLKDFEVYECFYGELYLVFEQFGQWVYGNFEFYCEDLWGVICIVCVGCFVMLVILVFYLLLRFGVFVFKDIIVIGLVGLSVVGVSVFELLYYFEWVGSLCVYKFVGYCYIVEVQQEFFGKFLLYFIVIFIFCVCGILIIIQVWVFDGWFDKDVWSVYCEVYGQELFICIVKVVKGIYCYFDFMLFDGINFCDIGFEMDVDIGCVVLMLVIDNFVKGMVGYVIQLFNVVQGWDECVGLGFLGLYLI